MYMVLMTAVHLKSIYIFLSNLINSCKDGYIDMNWQEYLLIKEEREVEEEHSFLKSPIHILNLTC